ncbi:MAG: hypothetical protein H0W61_15875, partial [Bacteroidetes bacterium]|nr:hypothetical protein [Bacteroidota bacterium]
RDKNTSLKVYKSDGSLKISDSLTVDLGKHNVTDFLQLSSDTLHDFLNIYLQRKEKKLVQIIRLNKQFKLVANIESVDIARLNSISAFESEIYYHKKDVYSVKVSNSDTLGKQFYLNKYTLKSELKNFEYELKWQFPFEKKNINSAHIILVTSKFVMLYVNVTGTAKAGQWILKIDPVKGLLIHGTRLSVKGDKNFYSFGSLCQDTVAGMIYILGQKLLETDFSQKDNKINIAGKPFVTVFLAQMDSASEIIKRDEFKVPVLEQKGNKTPSAYLLRQQNLRKTNEGNFLFETDIYKGNNYCYLYCNTLSNTITLSEDKLLMDKGAVTTNTLIEKFYFTTDKADMNGRLCVDSLSEYEKIYYKSMPFVVKAGFKTDATGTSQWLLKKSDSKKGVENFTVLKQDKKIYNLITAGELLKAENPTALIFNLGQYIIFRQPAEDKFEIKLSGW